MIKRPRDEAVINASDNEFVEDLRGNKIIYTKDFYIALYKKLETGMDPLAAYEATGQRRRARKGPSLCGGQTG